MGVASNIVLENTGPIESLAFSLKDYGVTVLLAPNGSGKSIALSAIAAAARGKGKVPLRDHAKRGKVEAFGAKITLGGTCRHTGEFEVENLEGRFDLAILVDPGLVNEAAADAHRIKALVALTGVEAKPDLFQSHEAFADWSPVRPESLKTDDLCEMARLIKADYDSGARALEAAAEKEIGFAAGLDSLAEAAGDLTGESDADRLQKRYDAARDFVTTTLEQQRIFTEQKATADNARKQLNALKAPEFTQAEIEQGAEDAANQIQACDAEILEFENRIKQLQADIEEQRKSKSLAAADLKIWQEREKSLASYTATSAAAQKIVEGFESLPAPDAEEVAAAEAALIEAKAAQEKGVLIRNQMKQLHDANGHREKATEFRKRAEAYREAGRATDAVLSASIQCPNLRVESDGERARLVTDTDRGKSIPYHELSDGERWTIAIDLGADQVGTRGLLVIPQIAWEGIDGANRELIHRHAKERQVYILTAEAAADPKATREIKPTLFSAN